MTEGRLACAIALATAPTAVEGSPIEAAMLAQIWRNCLRGTPNRSAVPSMSSFSVRSRMEAMGGLCASRVPDRTRVQIGDARYRAVQRRRLPALVRDVQVDRRMRASEIMTPDPMTMQVTALVSDALQVLQTLEIRHLPIVDHAGRLVGMLSDRDVRAAIPPYQRVTDLMSSDVVTVGAEDELQQIIDLLLEE